MENKTGKYFKYAIGEIILVMVGILLALQVNNWNEGRKMKIQETKLLVKIRSALSSDLENQFNFHIERTQLGINSLELILTQINEKKQYNETIIEHFGILSVAAKIIWTPQLTAFKQLESRGMAVIRNDQLLEEILNIYTLDYPQIDLTFDNYKRNIYEYGRPIMRRKFVDDHPNFVPVNYEELLNNVEFRNTVSVLLGNNETTLEQLIKTKGNVEHVIDLIDKELKQ